jgi:DNA-binding transcriptional LysR family regulator
MTNLRSFCVIHSIFGVAVSRQHPLAERKNLTLRDLRRETLFCVGSDEKASHRDAICRIYNAEGAKPGNYRKIDGCDSMITLIAADQGISILPHALDLANQDIVIIPIIAHKAKLDFHMWAVWDAQSASNHVKHFIELLEERIQRAGAGTQTLANDVVSIRDYQTAI